MNPKKPDAITRWRNRHGFGVHSPFAYRIIKRVVAPGRDVAYYGYNDIDVALGPLHMDASLARQRDDARMLLRLAEEVSPRAVLLPQNASKAVTAALNAGAPKARLLRYNSTSAGSLRNAVAAHDDIVMALFPCGNNAIQNVLPEIISALARRGDCCVVLFDASPDFCGSLFEALDGGVLIHSKRISLLFRRRQTACVAYFV